MEIKFSLVIDTSKIPKGVGLAKTAEIDLGGKRIRVTPNGKRFIDNLQTSLGHPHKRNSIEHLIDALAVSQEQAESGNESISDDFGVNGEAA